MIFSILQWTKRIVQLLVVAASQHYGDQASKEGDHALFPDGQPDS